MDKQSKHEIVKQESFHSCTASTTSKLTSLLKKNKIKS